MFWINFKVEAALVRKRHREVLEAEESSFSFKKFADIAKSIIQTKEDKVKEDLRENCNLVYYELSTFITFFVNLGLPFEVSS